MPGMDIARTQIPYLPPEWTVGRGLKYAAKLAAFIVVPGLHQIACNRRILGGLLMLCYFSVEFVSSNKPMEPDLDAFHLFLVHNNLFVFFNYQFSELFQIFSWLLLALDLRKLETRKLRVNLFVGLACAAGIYFVPHHNPLWIQVYVEPHNYVCPPFCKYDIIEYESVGGNKESLLEGDYVAIDYFHFDFYTSKLVAGPLKEHLIVTIEEACAGYGDDNELQRIRKKSCEIELQGYSNDLLTIGGPDSKFKSKSGEKISLTSYANINGVKLRRIGNTHEYFVFTDELTDYFGNALLVFYKWTGFNLFGLTEGSNR